MVTFSANCDWACPHGYLWTSSSENNYQETYHLHSPYDETGRYNDWQTSLAAKRYSNSFQSYQSFYTLPKQANVTDGEFSISDYAKSLKGKPLIFFDRVLNIKKNEQVESDRFFYCASQSNDPIVSILFYDLEEGGGCGISNGKELKAGKYHEIPVKTVKETGETVMIDGKQFVEIRTRQYIDLSFQGGDAQFTLFAKTKSGVISNPAILRNGTNAILAAKK